MTESGTHYGGATGIASNVPLKARIKAIDVSELTWEKKAVAESKQFAASLQIVTRVGLSQRFQQRH